MNTFRRRLHPPWLLAAGLLLVFAVVLVVSGYVSSEVGNDAHARDPVASDHVPRAVNEGGAIVDATGSTTVSSAMPSRTIALTFDDGPDPTWTPRVLAVLKKHHVHATFFVVGSMAARHPELVRAIHDEGSEIGLHTFTHPDLATVSPWRFDRELAETQYVIAGSAGISTALLRPPYSSSASAIDNLGYRTLQAAGRAGYVGVFTDVDSEDWQRPGVHAILRNATPRGGHGAVVLMHDAGGDRAQTVAALDRLIPRLQQEGYHFDTVSGATGLAGNTPATTKDHIIGQMLLSATGVANWIVRALQWILIGVGVLVVVRLLLMLAVARRHARRRHSPTWSWGAPVAAPVSVIVPAYNERENIEATLRSILANDHPLEVIVVDDGSTDGTPDLVEALALPRVRVIRQPNSGKAGALNAGIAAARNEFVVMMDGDTVFEADTVRRIIQPFADPRVGAVAGNVKVANRDTLLGRLQHIEYVIGFNIDRRVYDLFGAMPTIPGAAGAFRRRALVEVGGLCHDTLAEDTDLTIAIVRAGWQAVYEDRAVAWTEAPSGMRQLWQQRYRWTYGTMQAMWKHRRALVEHGASGRIGRLGLLHLAVFQVLLPLSAPLIDVFLVYGLFFLNPSTTLILWSAVMAVQMAAAAFAFHWDEEPKGVLWVMPLQQIAYRQLMYMVLVQSLVTALAGTRVRWQKLRRVGGLDTLLQAMPQQTTNAPAHTPPRTPSPPSEAVAATPMARGTHEGRTDERPLLHARDWPLMVLATLALVPVVGYHWFGAAWQNLLFPAMGVLFAAGGSLTMLASRHTPMVDVIGHGLRRLLVPLWVLGAVLVPVMLWHGWPRHGDDALQVNQLVLWVLPVLDPPASSWASDAHSVLWAVRTCLWLLLLTPLLLRAYRKHPVIAMLTPVAVLGLLVAAGPHIDNWGAIGQALLDLCLFSTCWMAGFAHRDGSLYRVRPVILLVVAVSTVASGAVWLMLQPLPGDPTPDPVRFGQALVAIGVVLMLLRIAPRLGRLQRVPVLNRLVAVLTTRLIIIYLWHTIAFDLAAPIVERLGWQSTPARLAIAMVLLAFAVLAFGRVEDLAMRRKAQFTSNFDDTEVERVADPN